MPIADDAAATEASFRPMQELTLLRAKATSTSAERPPKLPLAALRTYPALFQPRGTDEQHIALLAKAIQSRGSVEPILVLQAGDEAVVIDGHHRRAAYAKAKVRDGIPVTYFDGTVDEALAEAGRANSRTKLPMTNSERLNFAWRLVLMGAHSKATIVDSASVSNGTVGNMRKVKEALGDAASGHDNWWRAQRAAKGMPSYDESEDEREERLEALAQGYADKLSRALGAKLRNNTEIAARALAIHFGRRLGPLLKDLREHVGEGDWDEDDGSDF